MILLGVDTSCDETAAAVVEDGHKIRSNVIASQVELHRPFGGVVPEIASRSHLRRLMPVLAEALDRAGVVPEALDAVAATCRPGLIGALLVGLSGAKALAWRLGRPFLGVDHVEAHVHAAAMADPQLPYPHVCLVASGGHTSLYLVQAPGAAQRLGRTLDDAAGEALDKAAALLGLGYPGGPALEAAAAAGGVLEPFPIPLLRRPGLDFSFSGLKTALVQRLAGRTPGDQERDGLARAFQTAVMEHIARQALAACARTGARALAIGGGVARNQFLRNLLSQRAGGRRLGFPPPDLCSDNGAMVAGLASLRLAAGGSDPLDLPAAPRSLPSK